MRALLLLASLVCVTLNALAKEPQQEVMEKEFSNDLLKAGTYWGHDHSKKVDYQLFLTENPGRKRGFIAVLVRDKKFAFSYVVDQYAPNKYGMLPLSASETGNVGPVSSDPSLSLEVVPYKNKYRIKILSNNSNNTVGFQEGMEFKLKDRSYADYIDSNFTGTFKFKKFKATVSEVNDKESILNANLPNLNGDFTLRQVRPNLHIVLKNVMTQSGLEVTDSPAAMAIFVEDDFIFARYFLIIIDLKNGHLTYLKKMR